MTEIEKPKKKRINSREKGKRGERAWRDQLRDAGFLKSYRAQQYSGTESTADVICPELPNYHFEVKVGKGLPMFPYDAILQAERDKPLTSIPIVAMRKDFCDWLIVMKPNDFFGLIKEAGHAKTVFCPDCKDSNISKSGKDIKGQQRYWCLNNSCDRVKFTVK